MLRTLFVFILTAVTISVNAQEESVFMQTDKKVCFVADTIWFRSFILTDSSRVSSNFYLELIDQKSVLLERKIFPVKEHACAGQITIPVKPGNYWLRGYTLNGTREAIIPINVLDGKDQNVVVKQSPPIPSPNTHTNLISVVKDQQQYTVNVASQQDFSYCIAVTAIDDVGSAAASTFPMPEFPKRWDTAGLIFHAKLLGSANKKNSDLDVHMYVQHDSANSLKTYLSLDSGFVTFQDLYFYGPAQLHYQLFKNEKPLRDNFRLELLRDSFPAFKPPLAGFRKDTVHLSVELPKATIEERILSGSRFKTLKAVEVKARWHDRHLALDKKYVVKDEFKATEQFTFDLRDPINPGGIYYVMDYLARELPPNWVGGTLMACKHIDVYVDEQLRDFTSVTFMPLADFAYAKIYKDLHPPCPAICLYTRHKDDVVSKDGLSNTLNINGYTKSLTWSQPDAITWLWNSDVRTSHFQFPAPSKPFKIVITGRLNDGTPILYEKSFTGDF